MSTAKRTIRALIVAAVAFFILAGAASASNHCGGGNGGGSVPLAPDWLLALMVAGMLGYGAFTLRGSTRAGHSTAVVIALLVLVGMSGAPQAEAGSDCPPSADWSSTSTVTHDGWNDDENLEWKVHHQHKGGRDKSCGPDSGGDGWFCADPVPNAVRFTGYGDSRWCFVTYEVWGSSCSSSEYADYRVESAYEILRRTATNASPATTSSSVRAQASCFEPNAWKHPDPQTYCSYPMNQYDPQSSTGWPPDEGEWRLHEFFDDGWFWIKSTGSYYYNGTWDNWGDSTSDPDSSNHIRQPEWFRVNSTEFAAVNTVGNVNLEPVMELLGPIGEELHRQGTAEHVQAFEMRATDGDGHDWTAEVDLTHPDSTVETFALNGDGDDEYSDGETAVLEVEMPHKNGTYSWRAKPTDTSGESNAEGDWTASSTFDFTYNLAPEIPSRVIPEDGVEIPEGQPVTFVIETTDPEEDHYQGTIQLRPAGNDNPATWLTLETTEAESGDPAAAQMTDLLAPRRWEWRAKATDLLGKDSKESLYHDTWHAFEVTQTVSNDAPGPPSLVAPPEGHTFTGSDPQDFTINAVDPERGNYFGVVTVVNGQGDQSSFVTELVASGENSSGSPVLPLGSDAYDWSAVAIDERGASSDASETRTFEIASGDAPGAPTLVEPANDHEFEHNDVQRFVVNAVDPQGEPYRAEVRIDGELACEAAPTPSGEDATCAPLPQTGSGSHTWDARAVDLDGDPGPWSAPFTFTVLENRAPEAPTFVRPDDGTTFAIGEPQIFAINSVDPDGDSYHGELTATNVDTNETFTFETAPSPSGSDSYGSPQPPLEPGDYTIDGVAVDVAGAQSNSRSASLSFAVNRPPATPDLVSPDPGREFGANEPQLFTINAADPDGDLYRGRIEFRDAATQAGLPDHTFVTHPSPSGEDSTGTPSEQLPADDFEWRAIAIDTIGSESEPSAWRPVSVNDGSTSSTSSTTTTTAPPGSQAGVGPVTGRVELASPGLPPILAPCEPSSFTFAANATAVAFDLDSTAFAGTVSINGQGGSECENAASGQGSLSVSAEGFGPGGAEVDCLSLEGGYERLGTGAQIVLRGDCEINNTATSPVVIRTAINLEPDDPEASVSGRVMGADFEGTFSMEPV